MHGQSGVTTYLFTDIEGSTRLWDQEPERMRPALARHDVLTREAVEQNRGRIVKTTGDGFHAVFDDPLDALAATLRLQLSLTDPAATAGVPLQVRCGLHAGIDERRDNDFFGPVVNRAARIMSAAHGGQILVSQAVATLVGERLPEGVTLRTLGAVRLRDLANPESIYQVVHPRLREGFPALRSLEATPNNLPQQVTSFIGRETDLAEVKKLLRQTRLLTLLGVGGLGKTRLSLQVAAEVLDDYPEGVWFIELAALNDEGLVQQAIASVLGVKEEAGRPVIDALAKFVAQRRLLIILDNCEHLVRACAEVARRLLQSGPGLKILTSSREALHMRGETTYPVPPLLTPAPDASKSAATLTQYTAPRLFVERALAVQPSFQVTAENAAVIAEICHRLDGIPLAIELAAARVRALSVDAIAARLGDRFRLLTQGDRTALPRQQTLRALIDWSYDLLTGSERVLLQRLSVFAGGWTVDAAEEVGVGDGIARHEILDLLTFLVEKSLVVLEPDRSRYRLLDTVREYAYGLLAESADEPAVRSAHLRHFVHFAEGAREALFGPEQRTWLARIDAESENLLAAHRWCDRADDGATLGMRLVNSVKNYWFVRGVPALGLRLAVEALNRRGAEDRNIMRCRTLHTAGQLSGFSGHQDEASRHLEAALSIARELGDVGRVATILQDLGRTSIARGQLATARGHLEEALALSSTSDNKRGLASALTNMAILKRVEDDLPAAATLYDRALALTSEIGDQQSVAIQRLNLAMVNIGCGNFERARLELVQVLEITESIGSKLAGLSALETCAGLAAATSQWTDAALFFGAAESEAGKTGIARDVADERFLIPLMDATRRALPETEFVASESAGAQLGYEQAVRTARTWLEERAPTVIA